MVKRKVLKKFLAVTLSFVMTLGMANYGVVSETKNAGQIKVMADEITEPSYDPMTDKLLYYNESITKDVKPGISLEIGTEYKISFTVKSETTGENVWVNLGKEADGARVLLDGTRHAIKNTGEADEWSGFNPNLAEGTKVTAVSDGNKVSIWINGTQVKSDAAVRETNKSSVSEPSVTSTGATFSDVMIWNNNDSNETKYDADDDTLLFEAKTMNINAGETKTIVASVPEGKAYGITFGLKTAGNMWFYYGNDDNDRFLISNSQYHTKGLINNKEWVQLKNPIHYLDKMFEKVTVLVKDNQLSLWLNGDKIVDEETINNEDIEGLFKAYFSAEAKITNLVAWYEGKPPKSDEPEYNKDNDVLLYSADTFDVTSGTTQAADGVNISQTDTYYVSYRIKTQGSVYFTYRGEQKGSQAQIFVGPTQYGIIGLETAKWPQAAGLAQTDEGMKVTVISKPDSSTVYVNGEKIVSDAILKEEAKSQNGIPSFYADGANATVKDLKIWQVSDEPKYDVEKDLSKFYRESITIPKENKMSYGISIPKDTAYYATFNIKTTGGVHFTLRGDDVCRFYISPIEYATLGIGETDTWTRTATNVENGARVTIYCTQDSVSAWLDGVKIISDRKFTKNTGLRGKPGFFWTVEEATITNARVWIGQDAAETDEPKFSEEKHELKVDVAEKNILGNGKFEFGVSIPRYQDYYTEFNVKTDGGIYVTFRGEDKKFYIDGRQYTIIDGTSGEYIQQENKLSEGIKLSIKSTTDAVSVWIDGVCVIDDMEISGENQIGTPQISWTTAETTVTGLKVWTDKETFSHKFEWSEDCKNAKVIVTNEYTKCSYTYDAVVTENVVTKATCTKNGKIKYTATFGTFSDSKEIETKALGHKNNAKFEWSANGKSAKVTVSCANDSNETKTYDAKITSIVTTPATYFKMGVTTYKATYESYSDTKAVADIPKLTLGKTKKVTVKRAKKKQLKVSFKAVSGAKKYQIQYSLKKNFKKAKSATTTKNTYTIKKLKSKKKYYVRVRAVVTDGKNVVYGAWVKAKKSVKVK